MTHVATNETSKTDSSPASALPCHKEMPTLDRLQAALGGDRFEVVALSIDRGGTAAGER
ncbi:hypothetical protein M728_004933 (plasmid) [Ensifer sp. WSM1721]